jgi:hypothetical protein
MHEPFQIFLSFGALYLCAKDEIEILKIIQVFFREMKNIPAHESSVISKERKKSFLGCLVCR